MDGFAFQSLLRDFAATQPAISMAGRPAAEHYSINFLPSIRGQAPSALSLPGLGRAPRARGSSNAGRTALSPYELSHLCDRISVLPG